MIDYTKYIEVVFPSWKTNFNSRKNIEKMELTGIENVIENQQVDAVINPTDIFLTCFTGENSGIYSRAGELFIQKCKEIAPVSENAYITNGYNLPAKKIIHLIGPKSTEEKKIEKFAISFLRCLELANEYNLSTLAFPTIGFSPYEIYPHDIAQIVISNLKEEILQKNKIKKFIFVSNSEHFYNLYKLLIVLPNSAVPLFVDYAMERTGKLANVQNKLTKAIQKLNEAKNKIEESNRTLEQQKEEITLQNELLQQQKEEIITQNEQLQIKNDEITFQRDEIQLQKNELSKQKQNIIDSIQYASLIQRAILPSFEIIEQNFVDSFVLYRPCHIVSGDFYWFQQIKNFVYIVAADCTGHGVPGAFMCMLGISLLNEIVSKQDVIPPNLILNELRNRIKKSLHQSGQYGEQQDGMDISFCSVNLETNIVQFSGAYNPLYLVRNKELIEYKADRMPIGIHPKDRQDFTNKEIQLQIGDNFYIFSDGYISQFGGINEDTFKSKRFQELLLKINGRPMKEQHEILNKTLDNWRGELSQTDDVLVIGIHINIK